ncbi:hypothetical protein LTR28_010450 [Elasticomyces elasticus]|nr:hypothetical protein LTR28_010450 [Elasticomyces elasticus]
MAESEHWSVWKGPGEEVWHRRFPPRFPFAETPFIEWEMSCQINRDLGHFKQSAPNPPMPPSPWALPELSAEHEEQVAQEVAARIASASK